MANHSIKIYKGTTFVLPLTLKDGCSGVDLSEATITGKILGGSPQYEFTYRDIDSVNGRFEMRLNSSFTANMSLPNNVGTYQIKIDYNGSPEQQDIMLEGSVIVVEG